MKTSTTSTTSTASTASTASTIAADRKAYREARVVLMSTTYADAAAIDAAVRELLAGIAEPTSGQWVKAIGIVKIRCGRCAGTGAFVTMVVNGRPTGPGGGCFRCGGTGAQTLKDAHRNLAHDRHYAGRMI